MKGVVLIKFVIFKNFNCLLGIIGSFILDEGASYCRASFFIKWHEEAIKIATLIVCEVAYAANKLKDHLAQLLVLCFWYFRKIGNHDTSIEALIQRRILGLGLEGGIGKIPVE